MLEALVFDEVPGEPHDHIGGILQAGRVRRHLQVADGALGREGFISASYVKASSGLMGIGEW